MSCCWVKNWSQLFNDQFNNQPNDLSFNYLCSIEIDLKCIKQNDVIKSK
jgi:hypothetical protein